VKKTLRTTNVIERLNEEFRRRVRPVTTARVAMSFLSGAEAYLPNPTVLAPAARSRGARDAGQLPVSGTVITSKRWPYGSSEWNPRPPRRVLICPLVWLNGSLPYGITLAFTRPKIASNSASLTWNA
jgi:hypothetical protein